MFCCDYDGHESDGSSLSDSESRVGVDNESEVKAKTFNELMSTELDALMFKTSSKFHAKLKQKSRKVKFKTSLEDGETDFNSDEKISEKDALNDPLCDYDEDNRNENWVKENLPGGKTKSTDAVLNCPGCMSVLAVDCRRHPYFKTHYSSSFPINCHVDESQVLDSRSIARISSSKGRKNSVQIDSIEHLTHTRCNLICDVCSTSVGNKDMQTGLVYFNDVLASHS